MCGSVPNVCEAGKTGRGVFGESWYTSEHNCLMRVSCCVMQSLTARGAGIEQNSGDADEVYGTLTHSKFSPHPMDAFYVGPPLMDSKATATNTCGRTRASAHVKARVGASERVYTWACARGTHVHVNSHLCLNGDVCQRLRTRGIVQPVSRVHVCAPVRVEANECTSVCVIVRTCAWLVWAGGNV